jgi:hypothetical protein
MRPTVLRTPELAAEQTMKEEQRLPGISEAAAQDVADEHKAEQAQQKRERLRSSSRDTSFQPVSQYDIVDTNTVALPNSGAVTEGASQNPTEQTQSPGKPSRSSSGNAFFQPLSPSGFVDTNAMAYPNP